jgi:hypothetical protein
MTVKLLQNLTISGILLTMVTGCSILPWSDEEPPKVIEKIVTVTKKEPIKITQPVMPRAIKLESPKWYVVSETEITNPCLKGEDGKKDCSLGRKYDYPDGYTYLDKFIDEIKKQNGGDVVFTATTINDYELMARNVQELRRYIRELGEVIVYYRTMTMEESDNETTNDKPKDGKTDK